MKQFSGMLAVVITVMATACAQSGPMNQPASGTTTIRSSVETITWTDGKAAYSINCDAPGGCMQRSLQMCNTTMGNYQVLNSTNMPTTGDARNVRGPASVVIRCG
jgi:hypothetical protein